LKIIAHRGATQKAPENTLIAFEHAMQMGVDAIEADLLLTQDGHIVLRHDNAIAYGADWRFIKDMRLSELKAINLGGCEKMPSLEEFIERFAGKCPLVLDLKCAGLARKIIPLLERVKRIQDIHITSFIVSEMAELAQLKPHIDRSLVLAAPIPGVRHLLDQVKANEISLHYQYISEESSDNEFIII